MLSVNIPVYNVEIVDLVKQLGEQARVLDISYEIRVYDDGSEEIFKSLNKYVAQLPNVVYYELPVNKGRAAIRNLMGQASKHKFLLFIDADSSMVDENYLKRYIENIKEGRVICGGTAYSIDKPLDKEKLLRWTYGQQREAIPARIRNKNKGFIITSNNFLIEKRVLEQIPFRESLKKYGHEDTVLGFDLFQAGCEIFHIDNPVEHTGLESAAVFLKKSKEALRNLLFIAEEVLTDEPEFARQVNFLRKYHSITRYIPKKYLHRLFGRFEERLEANLSGTSPTIRYFDLYKLGYYASIKNR